MSKYKNLDSFNCFSYAMEVYDEWLENDNNVEELGWNKWANYGKETLDEILDNFVMKDVLVRFPNLKIVKLEEIKSSTKLIAVKLAKGDFHFMKRFANNNWYEKHGGLDVIRASKELAFSDVWDFRGQVCYNSKTIFLGYKEDYI